MSPATVTPFHANASQLTEQDFASLRGIERELAIRAQLYRVNDSDGAALVGRVGQRGNYSGIVFPNIWPGQLRPRSYRLRRDQPDIEIHKGQRREKGKYMAAPGDANRLFFTPGTSPEYLDDIELPVVIAEGEKKALALQGIAEDAVSKPRFLAIALTGVWSWRCVNGKTTGPNGERQDTKGPTPDLSRLVLDGRIVYILFDANTQTNPSVAAARNQLAVELTSRGAKVSLIDLPPSDGVNGIDDYLGKYGPEAGLKLFESARPFDPSEKIAALPYTDAGNEAAFEIMYGEQFRYNVTKQEWLDWCPSPGIWQPDVMNRIDRCLLTVAKARLEATAKASEEDRRKVVGAALKLQNVKGRKAAIESATSNPRFARRAEDFDQNDYLLASANGVINLRSGEFRLGRHEDMVTRKTSVAWDPIARCDRFLRFLSDIFQRNLDMLDFIQRAVGYSLTGLTREEVFFILYGKGRNGKGTLLRILQELLGDYAVNMDFSALIADKSTSKGPRNDLASMAGRRFVTAQESREGAQFDESLIKALTGGDLITARFLHKEFFTFKPTWKIWIATNHRPEIRGSDDGIWSRPKLIPFDVSFEGREDRGLKDALLDPRELSGVLNWAVEGCLRYLESGLNYPQAVNEATAQYKADSDFIGRFISECCLIGQGCVQARRLYQSFVQWVNQTGEQSMTETAFARRMKERGYAKERKSMGMTYQNVALNITTNGAEESRYAN